jgi:Domain of unknown function (DUF1816)
MKYDNSSIPAIFSMLYPQKMFTSIAAIWADVLNFCGRAWWVEVVTAQPICTYFFGPFANLKEAQLATPGYIADLKSESAQEIKLQIKRCKPEKLTIEEAINDNYPRKPSKLSKIISSYLSS